MHFHERTTFGWVSCIGETGSTHCAQNLGFEYPQYNGKWMEGDLNFFLFYLPSTHFWDDSEYPKSDLLYPFCHYLVVLVSPTGSLPKPSEECCF